MMGEIHIGISGWRYAPWRSAFYPKGLVQRRELEYASRRLSTIEINGSFYALQSPKSYSKWYADTPENFVFSVKATRYVTHILRLRDIEKPLANFFASGLFNLRDKLGPILWQFPPSMRFNAELFESFMALLPTDTEKAQVLAGKHEAGMKGRTSLAIDKTRPMRHAIEIRNESFIEESFIAMLRRYHVALVVADTANKWPYREDLSSDFIYMRLHGDKELYASGYSDDALERWAGRIRAWSKGGQPDDARLISQQPPGKAKSRDVFCYFDNDVKTRAPFDAQSLANKLGLRYPAESDLFR